MDVVFSETRSGLPSELLYAGDFVLMSPTIEHLGIRVAEGRVNLLDKGLKVNAGKSKLMVGSRCSPVVSVGKECMQTMLSTAYVRSGFLSRVVVVMYVVIVASSSWFQA